MKRLLSLLLVFVIMFSFVGCGTSVSYSSDVSTEEANEKVQQGQSLGIRESRRTFTLEENAAGREQYFTEVSQSHFNQVQPPKMLDWSLEREQLNSRNERWNDPNKLSYIYLLSDMGTILTFFPIKGKVSSVNSKLTANQQVVYVEDSYEDGASGAIESPSMDGSYGTNGDAIFFFLTDGTYMEWNGKYLLSDNYITLMQEPIMMYNVDEE